MAQRKRGPGRPGWVVKRTEVQHSQESEVHMENWQAMSGVPEAGAGVRRALAVLTRLWESPRGRTLIRRALEETEP